MDMVLIIINNIDAMFKVGKDKLYSYLFVEEHNDVERIKGNTTITTNIMNLFSFNEPDYIIDNIYLGNSYNAANYKQLHKYNIKAIINVTSEISNYFEDTDDIDYIKFNILDENGKNIDIYFNTFLKFVEEHKNNNILVHCFMGASRSASLVLLYLIKKKNMEFEEALHFLCEKRKYVNINTTFISQIKKYLEI